MGSSTAALEVFAPTVRWFARITSVLMLVVLALFVFGEGGAGLPSWQAWVGFLFFPAGVSVGFVLAWRREALGAMVSISSLLAFYLVAGWLLSGRLPSGPWFAIFTSPALLFLLSSYLSRHSDGGTPTPQARPPEVP